MEKRDEYSADKLSCARSTREVTPKWISSHGHGRTRQIRLVARRATTEDTKLVAKGDILEHERALGPAA